MTEMPPKKKSPPKAANSSVKEMSAEAVESCVEDAKQAEVTEREAQLQEEHIQLTAELEGLRRRVEHLRRENELLQEEAERVRAESQEYLSYMSKRSQRRQDAIVSLSDQNQRELEEIRRQKEELESRFQEEEEQLRGQLLQREAQLGQVKKEIEELQPMKELQREQLSRIKELEEEVMSTHGRHAEVLLRVKSAFLRDKAKCQRDSEHLLVHLSQEAQEEARKALLAVSTRAKEENQLLRQELLHLIHHSRVLQAQKQKLEEQNKQLLREQQCREELGNAHHKLKRMSITPGQ
ncbi:hypothetical protein FKM82_021865 [Ascaphus truei]